VQRKLARPSRCRPDSTVNKPTGFFGRLLSVAAERCTHAMDKQGTIVSERLPPPKRQGKRRKPQPPVYQARVVGPARTLTGVATFCVMVTVALALAAGAGVTNGSVVGPDCIGLPLFTMSTSAGLFWKTGFRSVFSNPGGQPPDPGQHPNRRCSLATALASTESFRFDGRTAVTQHTNGTKRMTRMVGFGGTAHSSLQSSS